MQLKKLKLKNIRSYKEAEIEFPVGSTLLMGEIGSGKTSVLLAIEFALFGLQPSQKGSSLLRNNETEASVSLELEIDGNNIVMERKLKRGGKSINQSDVSISIENERIEGSVTEIKNKILSLLNYPPEFAKKTNDLYKFTVYTPQEEMKQIIMEPPEVRLNTLRHIFGIDKYKIITENLDILCIKLRQEIRIRESQLGNPDQKKQELEQAKQEVIQHQDRIKEVEKNLAEANSKREEKNKEIKELETKISEKNNLEKEKAKAEIMLLNKRDSLRTLEKEISSIIEQLREGKKFQINEDQIASLKSRIDFQEQTIKESTKEYLLAASKIQSQEAQKKELDNLKRKIAGMQKCPTCLQEVNEEYKKNIMLHADEELNVIFEQNILDKKKCAELQEKIDQSKKQIELLKRSFNEAEIIKVKLETLKEKEQKLEISERLKISINKDLAILQEQIKNFNVLIADFDKYTPIFEQKNTQLQEIISKENNLRIARAEINKEIQFLEKRIKLLLEEIVRLEELSRKISYLKELEAWLGNKFSQLIFYTEKNVLLKLREEFSQLFSKWFSILVPEDLNVRLDETFSPIIQQNDFELDYNFLSGGERTAVALAYRLALNQIINSLLSKIKTRDLVILDEPTDGFSDAQLDKMREVLRQLNVRQLILVSHEQKIEGFVDNIIKFKKTEGVTELVA